MFVVGVGIDAGAGAISLSGGASTYTIGADLVVGAF
jgi:hypothetical protein